MHNNTIFTIIACHLDTDDPVIRCPRDLVDPRFEIRAGVNPADRRHQEPCLAPQVHLAKEGL